jgi:hypothetical protein
MPSSEEKGNGRSARATFRLVWSQLKDGAQLVFYVAIVVIAMAGWLYFIGRLLWQLASWIFS